MTEQEFNLYFKQIATNLVAISHTEQKPRFALVEELDRLLRKNLNSETFILTILHEEGSLTDLATTQRSVEMHSCEFAVLKLVKPESEAETAYTESFAVARQIVAKMLKDFREGQDIARWLLPDSFKFSKVISIADSHHGWVVSFSLAIKAGCDYVYNETDWL